MATLVSLAMCICVAHRGLVSLTGLPCNSCLARQFFGVNPKTTRKKQNTRAARVGCASAQTKGVAIRSRHSVKSRAHASTYRAAFEPGRARYRPPTAGIATASRTLVILRTRLVGSAPKDAIRVIFEPSSTRQMPYFSKRRAARERQRGPGGASSFVGRTFGFYHRSRSRHAYAAAPEARASRRVSNIFSKARCARTDRQFLCCRSRGHTCAARAPAAARA